jgi:hypothetical protein
LTRVIARLPDAGSVDIAREEAKHEVPPKGGIKKRFRLAA